MSGKLELQSLGVAIIAQYNNPSILNADFLGRHSIVPEGLLTADKNNTFCTSSISQVVYQEGLSIISNPERLDFRGGFANGNDVKSPDIAIKYLKKVHLVQYKAVDINLTGHMRLSPGMDHLLINKLMQEGPWGEYNGEKPSVALNFNYKCNDKRFVLAVHIEKGISLDREGTFDILVFRGNMHRDIELVDGADYSEQAIKIIGCWKSDLEEYKEHIKKFSAKMMPEKN